jgi:hypothetical protein
MTDQRLRRVVDAAPGQPVLPVEIHGGQTWTTRCSQRAAFGVPWEINSIAARKLYGSEWLATLSSLANLLFRRLYDPQTLALRRKAMKAMNAPTTCGMYCNSISILVYPAGTEGIWHSDRNYMDALAFSFDVGSQQSDGRLQIGDATWPCGWAVGGDFSQLHRATPQTVVGAVRVAVACYIKTSVARKCRLGPTTLSPMRLQHPRHHRRVRVWCADERDRNPRWYAGSVLDSSVATGMAMIRFDVDNEVASLDLRRQLATGLAEFT